MTNYAMLAEAITRVVDETAKAAARENVLGLLQKLSLILARAESYRVICYDGACSRAPTATELLEFINKEFHKTVEEAFMPDGRYGADTNEESYCTQDVIDACKEAIERDGVCSCRRSEK